MPEQPDWAEGELQPLANAAIYIDDLTDPSGCTLVPNSVLDNDRLDSETRLVYVMLRRLAAIGDSRLIDQGELARRIGIPAHSVPRHLALLRRRGLIHLDEPSNPRTPNRYRLEASTAPNNDLSLRPPGMGSQGQPKRATNGSAARSLADRLIVLGVDPQVARRLVADYPNERVAGALRAAHRRHPPPRDPAAWVVAAIRHGWVAPDAAVAARQQQAAQEQAIAAWEQQADAALAALPAQTQQSLRRQATEVVERMFDQRLAATTIGAMLITAQVRRLVAEYVGLPTPDTESLPD